MFSGFEHIVEERIKMAQYQGMFENLPGAGKPLDLSDDRHVPEDLRLAYKILKNADCIPPEIEMRKEIRRTEDLLAGMKDTAERYRVLKKLNFMIMKLNATRDSDTRFEMPQKYMSELTDRMVACKDEAKP
jgi:hypothetical protein